MTTTHDIEQLFMQLGTPIGTFEQVPIGKRVTVVYRGKAIVVERIQGHGSHGAYYNAREVGGRRRELTVYRNKHVWDAPLHEESMPALCRMCGDSLHKMLKLQLKPLSPVYDEVCLKDYYDTIICFELGTGRGM